MIDPLRLGEVMRHAYMNLPVDSYAGHDRRVRLCGRCHSWFLLQGVRSRFCESCRSESEQGLALPWLGRVHEDHESEVVTAT